MTDQRSEHDVEEALIHRQDVFVWEAPEYEQYERGPRWYFVMALIAVFLVAYALWAQNFLFAFFILLSAILIVLAGNRDPKITLAQIGHNGIVWEGKLHHFKDIERFAVVYDPPTTKVLYIELQNSLIPRIRIPLEDQDPSEIRTHLKQYLQENLDLQDEYFSDIFARLIRL